nr:hybrid sensor histidine kinase/response regulator [Hymenobacter pini]
MPQPFIYALAQDRAGYLWIGTAEGLVRFDGTTFQTFTTHEGLAEDFVTRLSVDARTGQLWVAHYQGGVSVSQGSRFRRAITAEGKQVRFKGLPTPDTATIGRFRRRYHPALPTDAIISQVLRDAEGTYWIGTTGLGLWRLTDAHLSFSPTPTQLTALAGRGALIATGTADGQIGRLLFTTNGLSLLSWSELKRGSVTALLPISNWGLAGTEGNGVYPCALVATDADAPDLAHLPADLHVTTLTLDEANDNFFLGIRSFWVGTIGEGAFHVTGRQVRHYNTTNGLPHNDVYAILPDRQGRVWFATHGTGLAVLENGRFTIHRLIPGGVDATALAQDAAGRVWIGTEGDGLFCYANGRFRQFTTRNSGLASNYCYSLQPTPAGLVVGHRNSLSLGHGSTFTPLSTPDNPIIRDLLPNAVAQLPPADSAVLLASRSGLVRVQLSGKQTACTSPITLTSVEVDGIRQPATSLPELSARPHRVTWLFRVASLAPAGTWQYQYRLRGFHDSWSRPTTAGEADFPRLDAGHYILEVRARRGNESAWSQPVTTHFSIATPFWRTGWFAALAAATGIGLAYAAVRARTATLRRQKLQLETTVRERTTELRHQKAEIEQINADLVVARDAAEASRRAKAQFLANMSHEIRTPMNAVIGLTHLLRNTPVTGEQNEYLEAIQSSSQNLLVIINDILDSSKIEAGKLTLEQAPFRLPELVERVARMFQFATEAKGLHLRTEVAPNVPAAILGDSVRLNQVLVNLVGNAVKFTTQGGVTIRVSLMPAPEPDGPDRLRFGISDTGIGIAPDKLDAIFEDFSQANTSTTRQFGGTGLGLSIARNLVQLHGGRLWVESQEGQGSTFWFDIPSHPADAATVPAEASTTLAPFEPALRVLVAEDNDLNQLVARKTLEAWNVQVTIAANGRLAVEAAQQQDFDAVLLDVQMPEMDGYEAARQLRSLFPNAHRLPLIGLTASALPEDRALALEAGMNDTLAKPFDPAVLHARLAHFTGRATGAATPPSIPARTTPPPSTATQPNWDLLEELAAGNDGFIRQIVQTFLSQAPALAAQLQQLPPGPELAAIAHKLKGQAAYFGVDTLTDELEYVELHARQEVPPNDLPDKIVSIGHLLSSLHPYLQARLTEAQP